MAFLLLTNVNALGLHTLLSTFLRTSSITHRTMYQQTSDMCGPCLLAELLLDCHATNTKQYSEPLPTLYSALCFCDADATHARPKQDQ